MKNRSKKNMLHLALAILAAVLILACGSGGGSDVPVYEVGPLYEGQPVGFECATVSADPDAYCEQDMSFKGDGKRMARFDIGNVPVVTSDAGAFGYDATIFTQLVVQNYTPQHHRYWIYIDYQVCSGSGTVQTYPLDILPMQTIDQGDVGSSFGHCASGANAPFMEISIFNGAGLADDELGDPLTSDIFAQAIINFSFSNSP